MRNRTFLWALGAITFAGLAVRVIYVLGWRRDIVPAGDAYFYHAGANLLVDGKGFIVPFPQFLAAHIPAADHPPLYTLFLAIPSALGMHSALTHMLWSCLLGASTIALVGLVGRVIGGTHTGLIAAVLAAIYPNIWAPDGGVQVETLGMFIIALVMLVAYWYWRTPTFRKMLVLGAVCGLAALTRSELILLIPILMLPFAWRTHLKWLAGGIAATVAVIAPWSVYNLPRFTHPVVLSTQAGPLLASANCDSTYYGSEQGYFSIQCQVDANARAGVANERDESKVDLADRRAAFSYIRKNISRLPAVESQRLLRIAGLLHPKAFVYSDSFIDRRELPLTWASLYSFYALALLAIAGAVLMWWRRATLPLLPIITPIGIVLLTVLLTYANTRFRTTAEPSLVLLAAVAIGTMKRPTVSRGDAPT